METPLFPITSPCPALKVAILMVKAHAWTITRHSQAPRLYSCCYSHCSMGHLRRLNFGRRITFQLFNCESRIENRNLQDEVQQPRSSSQRTTVAGNSYHNTIGGHRRFGDHSKCPHRFS
ncbi:hypothetical protein TMatcc_010006 [Talaromyces marneffei ATCC 18224]